MKVKLVCRRKHPCLKVMSNRVADEVTNQRKTWQTGIFPTLRRTERKKRLLNSKQCREEGSLPGQLYRHRVQRENKPDPGEARTSQRKRGAGRPEHMAHVSMKPTRAIQSERSQIIQLAWRLSQPAKLASQPVSESMCVHSFYQFWKGWAYSAVSTRGLRNGPTRWSTATGQRPFFHIPNPAASSRRGPSHIRDLD